MTRDDIIRMAREAECEETWGADAFRFGEVELERFVAIIAAAEREACATFLERGVDMAGLAGDPVMQKFTVELLLGCAAAIRARRNEMTNDRELLENAAKAAGMTLGKHTQKDWAFTHGGKEWNPLTDDGDALRLAVKLRMSVKNTEIRASVIAERAWVVTTEPHGDDPLAATRRAIVRAAAELGRSMK